MRRSIRTFLVALLALAFVATPLLAAHGHIAGRITRSDGTGIGGVIVQIVGTSQATLTEANGAFAFEVPPGTYALSFVAGDEATTENNVTVTSGETTNVEKKVDWKLSVAETITVYSASRRTERVVEAPAAVSVASEEDIQAVAPSGQAPRIVENAPGVDFTQSGLYDFNFNTRGFNSSLNRRILTLIDGRDPSVPFLGSQEWAALSFPIDEMASVELVRGPGSALYGANAFSGVLNMTTKQPKFNPGGRLMLTGGDLSTRRADFRHAGALGGEWYYRAVGGYQQSDDFTVSRNVNIEYPGLRREAVPLARNDDTIKFGGLRFDKYFANTDVLTLEGGYATLGGPTFQTGIGRVQVTDVNHPWARANYNMPHWNFASYYDARHANEQIALSSGAALFERSHNLHGEIQTNWGLWRDRAHTVLGVAYNQQSVDTHGTLMAAAHDEHQQAAFGQLDFDVTPNLKLLGAARYDESTLHDAQFSPKAGIVYTFAQNHTIRYGYNEAFQSPNYSEFFVRVPAAQPVNLSAIESAFAPLLGGTSLGFSSIPVLALGNENLEVEKVRSHELGYSGIFGGKLYVTADFYRSKLSNFVTDLLPGVNPSYPAYRPPSSVNPAVATQIIATLQRSLPTTPLPLFVAMTNLPGGAPAFVISYTNAGKVDTQGAELAFNYYVGNHWLVDFNYSWFDFDVKVAALGDRLLPNAPENKFNAGLAWRGARFDAKLSYRWVDEFPWAAGIFVGVVPQYDVVNLAANYHFTNNLGFGVDVSNLLGNEHYEAFGGDILDRRALGVFTVTW
ncbi:MAG: TonB-dependent receptor [Acidobacteria bacterium]|nr:TonB-dependent receptor [Acidobacteriota bacterium]MBV9476850.1 TonB-dependent receptor [Acidobacteriota bacterium]